MSNTNKWIVEDIRSGYVKYREGERVALIAGEILSGGFQQADYVLYPKTFSRWEQPYQNDLISLEEKKQIIDRICSALDLKNLKVEVEW